MTKLLLLSLLLAGSPAGASQKMYKKSSHATHQTKRNDRIKQQDSREHVVQDDIPKHISKNRKVHPPAEIPPFRREPTPIPSLQLPPMYRQESTVGFTGEDWRARGGGGGVILPQEQHQDAPVSDAQNIDIHIRGMQRLEGKRNRECCDRPEGQRLPNWLACFFVCCAGRK